MAVIGGVGAISLMRDWPWLAFINPEAIHMCSRCDYILGGAACVVRRMARPGSESSSFQSRAIVCSIHRIFDKVLKDQRRASLNKAPAVRNLANLDRSKSQRFGQCCDLCAGVVMVA